MAASGWQLRLRKQAIDQDNKHGPTYPPLGQRVPYCCDACQELLEKNQTTPSMPGSYDPYADAAAERIHGRLKQDFLPEQYKTNREGMKHLVKEIIRIYNI